MGKRKMTVSDKPFAGQAAAPGANAGPAIPRPPEKKTAAKAKAKPASKAKGKAKKKTKLPTAPIGTVATKLMGAGQEPQGAVSPATKKRLGKLVKYVKHAKTGIVYIETPALIKHRTDMIPCTAKGEPLTKLGRRKDLSDLTLREQIQMIDTLDDMVDMGARFGVGFEQTLTLRQRCESLLEYLETEGKIEPAEDE